MSPDTAARLSAALDDAVEHQPVLVIDGDRLDANADAIAAMTRGRRLRLVDKSLACEALLRRVAARTGANAFMSFHAPFLIQTALAFPSSDILLGKPLPARAMDTIFAALAGAQFDAEAQITWLVDTPGRVSEYAQRARALGVTVKLAAEIDIGLRRGGARDAGAFAALLDAVEAEAGAVRFTGLMGYDAHAAKAPAPFASPGAAVAASDRAYRGFIDQAKARGLLDDSAVFNGAGSLTAPLHGGTAVNDVSIGSAFVKPTDFDTGELDALVPAAFIATPVLKRFDGVSVPFIERVTRVLSPGRSTLFIYGGRWMAKPVWPASMKHNALYGFSSNQQMMTIARKDQSAPGDWAFFRPTQSEAVLTQFGRLRVVEHGAVTERWQTYSLDVSDGSATAQIASSPSIASA